MRLCPFGVNQIRFQWILEQHTERFDELERTPRTEKSLVEQSTEIAEEISKELRKLAKSWKSSRNPS